MSKKRSGKRLCLEPPKQPPKIPLTAVPLHDEWPPTLEGVRSCSLTSQPMISQPGGSSGQDSGDCQHCNWMRLVCVELSQITT